MIHEPPIYLQLVQSNIGGGNKLKIFPSPYNEREGGRESPQCFCQRFISYHMTAVYPQCMTTLKWNKDFNRNLWVEGEGLLKTSTRLIRSSKQNLNTLPFGQILGNGSNWELFSTPLIWHYFLFVRSNREFLFFLNYKPFFENKHLFKWFICCFFFLLLKECMFVTPHFLSSKHKLVMLCSQMFVIVFAIYFLFNYSSTEFYL